MLAFHRMTMACAMLTVALGCGLFSRGTNEVVTDATEVGTPIGNKTSKDIGPAGGTISSSDDRLVLTVPPNAVSENVTFSVQPISNRSDDGLGLGYRLEPSGRTFKVPVQISIGYTENEIVGAYFKDLKLAYQDTKGAWHEEDSAAWDKTSKRMTFSTTHLSDWSLFYGTAFWIMPAKANVYVGESLEIRTRKCNYLGSLFALKKKCEGILGDFSLKGPGTLAESTVSPSRVVYTAPPKKPSPNEATVVVRLSDTEIHQFPAIFPEDMRNLETKITILDRAYQAIAQIGDLSLSGTICSLNEPFVIPGVIRGYPMKYKFRFTPSSHTAGTVQIEGAGRLVTADGGGSYTIEGLDTGAPRIVMSATVTGHSPVGSVTKSGSGDLVNLVPLVNAECGGG